MVRLLVEQQDQLEDFSVLAAVLYEELSTLQIALRSSHFTIEKCGINERAGLKAMEYAIRLRLRVLGRLYEQAKNFAEQVRIIDSLHTQSVPEPPERIKMVKHDKSLIAGIR